MFIPLISLDFSQTVAAIDAEARAIAQVGSSRQVIREVLNAVVAALRSSSQCGE
jgi:hypothetical protein